MQKLLYLQIAQVHNNDLGNRYYYKYMTVYADIANTICEYVTPGLRSRFGMPSTFSVTSGGCCWGRRGNCRCCGSRCGWRHRRRRDHWCAGCFTNWHVHPLHHTGGCHSCGSTCTTKHIETRPKLHKHITQLQTWPTTQLPHAVALSYWRNINYSNINTVEMIQLHTGVPDEAVFFSIGLHWLKCSVKTAEYIDTKMQEHVHLPLAFAAQW